MAVTTPAVRVESAGDGIVTVTLADVASGNALGESTVHALIASFAAIGDAADARVVVLAAEGDMFSSGAPRELLAKLASGAGRPTDITLPRALLGCPLPVIAAVEGHAVGGGLALAVAADLVVLASESRYGFTFMEHGFTPGMGTTVLCEHVLLPTVVHELLYTGELRRGREIGRAGGFNHVVPRAQVRSTALDLAARIAEKPRQALELLKRTLSAPRRAAFESALTMESLMHELTLRAPGVRARLLETPA